MVDTTQHATYRTYTTRQHTNITGLATPDHRRQNKMKRKYYEPGTHISLRNSDDKLTAVTNWTYKNVLPLVAIYYLIDAALRVNGL